MMQMQSQSTELLNRVVSVIADSPSSRPKLLSLESKRAESPAPLPKVKEDLRVLLLSSSNTYKYLTGFALKKMGYMVDHADCPESALSQLLALKYEFVFIDLSMFGVDASTTVMEIRQIEKKLSRRIHLIALSPEITENVQDCLRIGMDDVVFSYQFDELGVVLNKWGSLSSEFDSAQLNSLAASKSNLLSLDRATFELRYGFKDAATRVSIYLGTLKTALSSMKLILEKKNSKDIASMVESLKEPCRNLGFRKLQDIAFRLLIESDSNDWVAVRLSIAQLERECTNAIEELSKLHDWLVLCFGN